MSQELFKLIKVYLLIFLVFILFFASLPFAKAITISPVILEISGTPGQSLRQGFKLMNETNKPSNFYLSAMNFKQKEGAEGEPQFFEALSGEESLANWMRFTKEPIFLNPGEVKQLEFTIDIPSYAAAGGYFAALFAGDAPTNFSGSGVGVSAKVGMLILLRVEGKVIEDGKLLEFKFKQGKKIYNSLPVDFIYRFENLGNVHLKPSGFIEIRNMVGRLSASLSVEPKNILPSSVRTFENQWLKKFYNEKPKSFLETIKYQHDNFALGRYVARLNFQFGKDNKVAFGEVSFWVLPWQLILFYLVIVAVLVIVLVVLIKSYNRFIISRAMNSKK